MRVINLLDGSVPREIVATRNMNCVWKAVLRLGSLSFPVLVHAFSFSLALELYILSCFSRLPSLSISLDLSRSLFFSLSLSLSSSSIRTVSNYTYDERRSRQLCSHSPFPRPSPPLSRRGNIRSRAQLRFGGVGSTWEFELTDMGGRMHVIPYIRDIHPCHTSV